MTVISSFTTREQYLNWCAAWKAQYKDLSIAIRTLKNAIAETQSGGGSAGTQQNRLRDLRKQATAMLSERLSSKIRAGLLRNNPELTGDEYDAQFADVYERVLLSREEKALAAKAAAKAACEAAKKARAEKIIKPRLAAVA